MAFLTNIQYDFSISYTYYDFEILLDEVYKGLFKNEFSKNELIIMLLEDYNNKRVNAFGYLTEEYDSLKEIIELRKSAILQLPKEYFENHPSKNIKKIREYRTNYLKQILEDYNDELWQYTWATILFIPTHLRKTIEIDYDWLIENRNPYSYEELLTYISKRFMEFPKKEIPIKYRNGIN